MRERWLQTVSEGVMAEIDAVLDGMSRTRWVEEAILMRLAGDCYLTGTVPRSTPDALEKARQRRETIANAYRRFPR